MSKSKFWPEISLIIALLILVAVFNPYSLPALMPKLFGKGLSLESVLVISALNYATLIYTAVFCLTKKTCIRELLAFGLAFLPMLCVAVFFYQPTQETIVARMLLSQSIFMILLLPLLYLLPRTGLILISIIGFLNCMVPFQYYAIYGTSIHEEIFSAVIHSNASESIEFLIANTSWKLIVPIIILLAVIPLQFFQVRKLNIQNLRTTSCIFFIACILISITGFYKGLRSNDIICVQVYNAYTKGIAKINLLKSLNQAQIPDAKALTPGKEIHVVIIDESCNREHYGIYGYSRPTSPTLEKNDRLMVFTDVISPNCHTVESLLKLLTFANNDDENQDFISKGSIFQYLRKAGYKSIWLSNQSNYGFYKPETTVLAKFADSTIFTNECAFDEKLINLLNENLPQIQDKTVIFINMMGKHILYSERYPQKYTFFSDPVPGKNQQQSDTINCYDNAVRYEDGVISSIIDIIDKTNLPATVTYFSDHGEDVCDYSEFFGHSEAKKNRQMFEIPFMLWTSEEFDQSNSERVNYWKSILARKFMTDNFPHYLLDLLQIDTPALAKDKSLLNEAFIERNRKLRNTDYDTLINLKR